jgi:UDPglucose--hexose-1-phosphate uridylyltransferase
MSIDFKKTESKAYFLNPFKDFSLHEIPFEIRYDPLTGETGRLYDLPYKAPERFDLEEIIRRSKEVFCPFCPEALEKSTPLFPKDFIPEGRIKEGDAILIPNLIPFDTYAAVSIMSSEHYLPIKALTPERLRDSFSAAQSFIRRVADYDPQVRYFSINWNYMPDSGSSLVHPHLQVNCGYTPTNQQRMQIEGCKRYLTENETSFWQDFVTSEKQIGERYIGEIGSTFWVLSFVPQTFLPDVWCIFPDHFSLIQADMAELFPFLQGLSSVLRYFEQENIPSFNLSAFSVKDDDYFRVNARICPRLLPRPIGNSDRAYLQTLHKESYAIRPPESVCPTLKEVFAASSPTSMNSSE